MYGLCKKLVDVFLKNGVSINFDYEEKLLSASLKRQVLLKRIIIKPAKRKATNEND